MTDAPDQTAAFLIDDRLKTHRKPGAGVTLVTQSTNDALGMKEAPNQTAKPTGREMGHLVGMCDGKTAEDKPVYGVYGCPKCGNQSYVRQICRGGRMYANWVRCQECFCSAAELLGDTND